RSSACSSGTCCAAGGRSHPASIARGPKIRRQRMSFPSPSDFRLVVATENDAGEPDFLEVGEPATSRIEGAVEIASYWTVTGGHSIASPGSVSKSLEFAELNGSTFGIVCFPAHSAGKLDVA